MYRELVFVFACFVVTISASRNEACRSPADPGMCMAYIPSWYYNTTTHRCVQFIYGGCGGNSNRYSSQADCNRACRTARHTPSPTVAIHPNAGIVSGQSCSGPGVTGNCRASHRRWFYNTTIGQCQVFIWGGCGGSANRYESIEACNTACRRHQSTHRPRGRSTAMPTRRPDPCQLAAEPGNCRAAIPRWHYDTRARACRTFTWGGCGGNENNFLTREECSRICG